MIIGIDAKELSKGKAGIAVYIKSMLDWFHRLDDYNQYILFSGKDFELDPLWMRCKKVLYKIHTTGSFEVAYGINRLIEENNVDVFWGPEHCIPLKGGKFKRIVTIHDIAVIINPTWGTTYNSLLQRFLVKKSLKSADRVVAISNSTKKDIINKFGTTENLISVIYNGDSPYNYSQRIFSREFEEQFRAKNNIPRNYFLYCGTIEPRKNIISIVEAFEIFMNDKYSDYRLVLAGGLGWKYEPIIDRVKRSPLNKSIVIMGYVSEEEKEYLYCNAEALIFPSYYEGFGFPIVEAMSVGTPVITACNSSLPEVGGSAAYYVEQADNTKQIAERMLEIISVDESEHESIRKNCIEQAKTFSRKKCASLLLKEFNSINT